MVYNMKKIFIYILIIMVLVIPFRVYAIVPRSDAVFVTDEAELLSDETTEYILNVSEFLYKQKRINYSVVTIEDLEGLEPSEYCEAVFEEYNLGKKGLLILVDSTDAIIRVQIGGELGKIFTENTISEFINTYFAPYIEHNDWDKGIKNGYNAFLKVICEAYELDASEVTLEADVDFITKYQEIILGFFMLSIVFISKLEVDLYRRMFNNKKYKDAAIDYAVFGCLLAMDLFILVLTYLVKDYMVILMLLAQFIIIYALYNNRDIEKIESEAKNTKKRRVRRKKVVINNRIKKKDR